MKTLKKMKALLRRMLIGQLVIFVLVLTTVGSSQAQVSMSNSTSVRRNVATIIFCGVGGAVLGISTLSFYGDPQNHIGNITTGFALGLLGGTAYVTAQATESTKEQGELQKPKEYLGLDPVLDLKTKNRNPVPGFSWAWNF